MVAELKGPQISKTSRANQGIWRAAYNTLLFSAIFGVLFGLTAIAETQQMFFSRFLIGALLGSMLPILACIQHLVLRIILYWSQTCPWNYSRFLNYAVERLFLQKVGGGYIFVHRLLLDYLAQLNPSKFS